MDEYRTLGEGAEAHWEVVERMLFIFAKLNPGIKYVQVSAGCLHCTCIVMMRDGIGRDEEGIERGVQRMESR